MAARLQILYLAGSISQLVPLFLSLGERLWIRIESNDIHAGMKALDQYSQSPGAAADVEDPKTWLNSCLIEERSSPEHSREPGNPEDL